jgi:hypothetical protein
MPKAVFRGREWGVIRAALVDIPTDKDGRHTAGLCDWQTRTIWLDESEEGEIALDTAIHEAIHALAPKWSEKRVEGFSESLSAYLYAIGYRREQHDVAVSGSAPRGEARKRGKGKGKSGPKRGR